VPLSSKPFANRSVITKRLAAASNVRHHREDGELDVK